MGSAGAYLQKKVYKKVESLVWRLTIPVGFHSHNNLGLSISNAISAVEAGTTILDGTIKEFGEGAGNAPIEVLVAGVFPAFAIPVNRIAQKYKVDSRDVFWGLRKRKVIGGQEGLIIEVATRKK